MKKSTAKGWIQRMGRVYPRALPANMEVRKRKGGWLWGYDYPAIARWLREVADALEDDDAK